MKTTNTERKQLLYSFLLFLSFFLLFWIYFSLLFFLPLVLNQDFRNYESTSLPN